MSRHLLAVAAIGLAALSGGCSAPPLHRSPASIRESLLKQTPAGTPYGDVAAYVNREGWPSGTSANLPTAATPHESMQPVIYFYRDAAGFVPNQKVKFTLDVSLGGYSQWLINERYVQASWIFGADERLLDIWVWKETDSF